MTNKKINSSIKENNFNGNNLNENNVKNLNDNNINGNNLNDNNLNGNNLNDNNLNGNSLNDNNLIVNNINDNNVNVKNTNDNNLSGNNFNNNIYGNNLNDNNINGNNLKELNVIKYNNTLPSLSRNNKYGPNLEENKNINITSNEVNKSVFSKENDKIEKKIKVKKNTIYNLLNNEYENSNKIKLKQKNKIIKTTDYEIEQDRQACRLVTLTLPDPLKINAISKRDKIEKKKLKNDVMNTLINSYRAKLFYKAHSPEEKIGINNELLEMPKKLAPAFGRTTYTFYFKKDKINCLNTNKNINSINFNTKKNNKDIVTLLKDDTGQ